MNGKISHMITLAAYGNSYLKGHINTSFNDKFFNNLNLIFRTKTGKLKHLFSDGVIAKTTDDWFGYLLKTNCLSIKLKYFQIER